MKKSAPPATGRILIAVVIFSLFGIVIPVSLSAQETRENEPAVKVQRPKIEYTADKLADPFQPVELIREESKKPAQIIEAPRSKLEVPLPDLKVQGLIWGGSFPQAIINNKIVKIGDVIEGATIKNIEKERITLTIAGSQVSIPTPSTEVSVSKKP